MKMATEEINYFDHSMKKLDSDKRDTGLQGTDQGGIGKRGRQ